MKKVLICCMLLFVVACCWGASTDTVKEASPTVKSPPTFKAPVFDESPGNIITIGNSGKYYKKERTFVGDINNSILSLIISELQLKAKITRLTLKIGEKQLEIERLQGK